MPFIVRGLERLLLLFSAPEHVAKRNNELTDVRRKSRDGGSIGLA